MTLAASVFFFGSCADMLEKNPQGVLSPTVLSSQDAVEKLAVAAYSPLNGGTKGTNGWSSAAAAPSARRNCCAPE